MHVLALLTSVTFLSVSLCPPPVLAAPQPAIARPDCVPLRTASLCAPALLRDPATRFLYDGDGGRIRGT